MTKEVLKKINDIVSAYLNGECIQYKTQKIDEPLVSAWKTINKFEKLAHLEKEPYNYRIKPVSKYIPFNNAEEFIKALQEHGNFIKKSAEYFSPIYICNNGIKIRFRNYDYDITFNDLFDKDWIFVDGTLCGKIKNN